MKTTGFVLLCPSCSSIRVIFILEFLCPSYCYIIVVPEFKVILSTLFCIRAVFISELLSYPNCYHF